MSYTSGGSAVERVCYDQVDWERYAANPKIALKMRLAAGVICYVPRE
jgi:hypothetical protein